MKSKVILAALLGLAIIATGCGQGATTSTQAPAGQTEQKANEVKVAEVTVQEAQKAFEEKSAVFIDVRTQEEFNEGHVPGAKLIPLEELATRVDEVQKDGKVYFICRSGNRSGQAAKLMMEKGYSNVYNVVGGMKAWEGPVEK